MNFLRTISTRRLLLLLAASAAIVGGGTAIAIAAGGGSGPKPPARPLAVAVHDALTAPSVPGISARITFTNHLIDSSAVQGSDPILSGATGRLWWSPAGTGHLRLELQSERGDAQILLDGRSLSLYDGAQKTVYRATLPAERADAHKAAGKHKAAHRGAPSVARIKQALTRAAKRLSLSGATPDDVAGHAAYTVRVGPKRGGGLLQAAELAWDSARGLPLRVAVYAKGNDAPVLELRATDISYESVPAATFAVAPPAGTKVVQIGGAKRGAAKAGRKGRATRRAHARAHVARSAAAVARALPFKLAAPASLAGMARSEVRMIDFEGRPGALVTYGRGLGGIAVIERPAAAAKAPTATTGERHRNGLELPSVSIGSVTGEELDTALGTVVRFTRAGISYTVLGSVSPATAQAAARAL